MNFGPAKKSTTDEFGLSTALARLGLGQYEERLKENGFDDWETLTAITESDMVNLNFKRGDRRILQRAIREYSNSNASHGLEEARNFPSAVGGRVAAGGQPATPQSSQQAERTTRPYRRHPRPDPNAPHKPKTAYVLFGEHVRQDPALSHSSFTEIAKEVGNRWRELSPEERVDIWETPAADRLQDYKKDLQRYKRTENYRSYQTYVEEFKRQQHHPDSKLLSDNKSPSTHESVSSGQLPASEGELEATRQESVDTDDLDLENQWQDTASPVKNGMEEARHIAKALGINAHLTRVAAFPPEDMTIKAVESFLHGTGSLLYLWDRDEALNLKYRPSV
ncbi:hypothetical protein N0V83_002432 [Neocucurbitaria cava]|uniref:HMG box domain-containing protein n=1 Tax=Neocucurbitaria cava TaxID=798079 RepID=A0A9W8YEP9_9PLEO|nr:hypothetical protein N0V83_002432 [Neocucurbitaria cava]